MDAKSDMAAALQEIAQVHKEAGRKNSQGIEMIADALTYQADAVHRLCDLIESFMEEGQGDAVREFIRRGSDVMSKRRRAKEEREIKMSATGGRDE